MCNGRVACVILAAFLAISCSDGPTSPAPVPSPPPQPPTQPPAPQPPSPQPPAPQPPTPQPPVPTPPGPQPPTRSISGITVDAITDVPIPSVMVRVAGVGEATSTSDGRFTIPADISEDLREVRVSSGATVERVTHMRLSGPEVRLTLLPSALDLRAFDEMFRHSGSLARWTTPPRIVVQSRVLQFTGLNTAEYTATADLMSASEIAGLLTDFNHGLPQLTGNTFSGFAGEDREQAAPGERVSVLRHGAIVVARYEGLAAATGFWGYSRWGITGSGEVQSGIIMLDRAFDTSGSPFRRSLRIHELGHALGYNHVTARDSVMNAHAKNEPNNFDRDAARFAFMRPPLNRSPDIDPDPFSVNLRTFTGLIWRGDR